MCGPWAIPLALIAAGSGAQYMGERRAQKARNQTFMAERERQNAMTEDQQARFEDSLASAAEMTDPAKKQAAVDERTAELAAAVSPTTAETAYLPGSTSAPTVVATANDAANEATRARGLGLAQSLAALGATNQQLADTALDIGRNSQTIDQISGFKRGSLGVLPAEMQAASNKGRTLRQVGGLAQSIGQAWLGGTMGAGGFGAEPTLPGTNLPGIY